MRKQKQLNSRQLKRQHGVDVKEINTMIGGLLNEIDANILGNIEESKFTKKTIDPKDVIKKLKNTVLELEKELDIREEKPKNTKNKTKEDIKISIR